MKTQGIDRQEKGRVIVNLPKPNFGAVLTGRWERDYYGFWYEAKRRDGTTFWMVGERPSDFFND